MRQEPEVRSRKSEARDQEPEVRSREPEWVENKLNKELIACEELQKMDGYPYNEFKDGEFIGQLGQDFPSLDLVEVIKEWKVWMLDNRERLGKKINYRARLRRWCKNATLWNAGKTAQTAGNTARQKYQFEHNNERRQRGSRSADPQGSKITDVWE